MAVEQADRWGVPDWRDESAYPAAPDKLSPRLWRWEFIRRMPDYRSTWDEAARGQHKNLCRRALKANRDLSKIRKPDDLYFVITFNFAAFEDPLKFKGLLKYKIRPFPNPRLRVPLIFEGGPSIFRYDDERGGVRALSVKPETRVEGVVIEAGWTGIYFDLTEPIPPQLPRARRLLEHLQAQFAQEQDLVAVIKKKTSGRPRNRLWPFYLRVLDARNEGVSFKEIGLKLGRCTEGEQARKDAHKWHRAASRIATSSY